MRCRCNWCMAEFPEEVIITAGGRRGCAPVETCPVCGGQGCIMDLGEYAFEQSNGNVGQIEWFMTAEEAISAAEYKWSCLTPGERAAYTDRRRGGVFQVYDDNGYTYRDWADEIGMGMSMNRRRRGMA